MRMGRPVCSSRMRRRAAANMVSPPVFIAEHQSCVSLVLDATNGYFIDRSTLWGRILITGWGASVSTMRSGMTENALRGIAPRTGLSRKPKEGALPGRTVAAWFLLCLAPPLFMLGTAAQGVPMDTTVIVLTLALTVYSGTHLAIRYGRGDLRIAETTFWLFVYVAMAVSSLAEISTGLNPILIDAGTMGEAFVIILAGCVAYDLSHVARRVVRRQAPSLTSARGISFARLNIIGVVGIGASMYYIQTLGGVGSFFSSRNQLSQSIAGAGLTQNGSQALSATLGSLALAPLILAWLGWTARLSRDKKVRRSGTTWLWYLILSAFMVILCNPIGASRYIVLTVVFAALFCLPKLGKKGIRFVIAAGVILAVTVFPYSDYFRVAAIDRSALQVNSISVELATKDYDQMTMTANGVWYANVFGHTNGSQLLSDVLFFIPHTVWSGRATDTGVLIGTAIESGNTNLSTPLWLEFWLDFSWLGLVIGMFLFGWISARWDYLFVQLRRRQRSSLPALLDLALPLFAGYQFILLRGPILQAMGRLGVMVVLLAIIRGRPLGEESGPSVD